MNENARQAYDSKKQELEQTLDALAPDFFTTQTEQAAYQYVMGMIYTLNRLAQDVKVDQPDAIADVRAMLLSRSVQVRNMLTGDAGEAQGS